MAQIAPSDAFKKNPDGSWTSVKSCCISIMTPSYREIKLSAGMTFRRGKPLKLLSEPVDIAQLLDEDSES